MLSVHKTLILNLLIHKFLQLVLSVKHFDTETIWLHKNLSQHYIIAVMGWSWTTNCKKKTIQERRINKSQ